MPGSNHNGSPSTFNQMLCHLGTTLAVLVLFDVFLGILLVMAALNRFQSKRVEL